MVSGVTNNNTNTSTSGTGSTPEPQRESLSQNYQDFLLLLTTQLKNQDPTDPTDTNALTQQIASLSSVEQQIATNKNLEQLIALYGATQTSQAVSYIGAQIDAEGNQGRLIGGGAAFAYSLPAGATSAEVTITNATGQEVFKGAGTTLAGRNQVLWDGKNNTTGADMPDGAYSIKVTAKDADGKELTVKTYTTGVVTAVDMQNGTTTLSIGDISVPASKVLTVRNPTLA